MMNARAVLAGAWLACACMTIGCRPSAPPPGGDAVEPATSAAQAPTAAREAESAVASSEPEARAGGAKPAAPVAASPGKPLPPIAFEYRILGTPVAGQPLEIEISTSIEAALTDLNVALSGNERLLVPVEMARLRLAAAAAGERTTRTVRVTPLAPGTAYLGVLLQAEVDGRQQSRAVTIPIRVADGEPPEEPMGTLSTDSEGAPIISLPGRDD